VPCSWTALEGRRKEKKGVPSDHYLRFGTFTLRFLLILGGWKGGGRERGKKKRKRGKGSSRPGEGTTLTGASVPIYHPKGYLPPEKKKKKKKEEKGRRREKKNWNLSSIKYILSNSEQHSKGEKERRKERREKESPEALLSRGFLSDLLRIKGEEGGRKRGRGRAKHFLYFSSYLHVLPDPETKGKKKGKGAEGERS